MLKKNKLCRSFREANLEEGVKVLAALEEEDEANKLKKKANYVEADEEMLLMAYGICEARKQFEYDSDGKRQHKAYCKWDCSNYHSATRVYLLQHNHRRFNTTLALLKWTFGVHRLKNSPTQEDGTWFAITEDFYKGVQRLFSGRKAWVYFLFEKSEAFVTFKMLRV
ncbi:unnamed protein product [Prunus armeniaca]